MDNDLDRVVAERFLDTDGDGAADCVDEDDDNDGYSDEEEREAGSDPLDPRSIPVIHVAIDVKPGSDPNSINCGNSKETITVAILTTPEFDATTVDHATVLFEGAGESHVNKKSGQPQRHEEDVDGDGDIDLVLHFRLGDTSLTCDSTEGTLAGETFGGQAIEGNDAVRMVSGRAG